MNAPLYTLYTPLSSILTNKRRIGALKSLGIVSVTDALEYYPFRITDPVKVQPLRAATIGEQMAFAAQVTQTRVMPMHARRGYRLEAIVDDAEFARSQGVSGAVAQLVFFSHRKSYIDWVSMRLKAGTYVVAAGQAGEFNGQLQFTHPELLTVPSPGTRQAADPMMVMGTGPGQNSPAGESSHAGQNVQIRQAGHDVQLEQSSPAVQITQAAKGPQTVRASRHGKNVPGRADYDVASAEQALERVRRPQPVYHANARISSEHIHETIVDLLSHLDEPIADILPEEVRQDRGLLHRRQAFEAVHNPALPEDFRQGIATLRYEEAFVAQISVVQSRTNTRAMTARACPAHDMCDKLVDSLPFALTNGQREVIKTISADLSAARPMQRLLQGEVGSGKTVVAICAMLQAVDSGFQAVLVAPTQVLAEQHMHTVQEMLNHAGMDIPVVLLTGGMRLAARRKALAQAAGGAPTIIIATHAAFSRTFQAPNLALVVIDEQHRFGVEQREALRLQQGPTAHLLVMTATPIPRTAAMTWFGDLDISWLKELPGGRRPIRTFVIPEVDATAMARMFSHIRSRIDAGERAYIVCPRIELDDEGSGDTENAGAPELQSREQEDAVEDIDLIESQAGEERPPLHAVFEMADRVAHLAQFEGIHIATLTGRDDDATKQRVMAGFDDGSTPVLVSTTVVEVGVDVPQASCMVIFDADRFGLSQLHQLRGRVGRGGTDSWAFLVSRAESGDLASQRLDVIEHSLDGSQIAQADLELRGAGDVLGDSQAGGRSGLKLLRVVKDADLIVDARKRAEDFLAQDPKLEHHVALAGAVLDFTRGNERFITSG